MNLIRLPHRVLLAFSLTALASSSVDAQQLQATQAGAGFFVPLYLCSPPGDTNRLFVVEQDSARIMILQDGQILGTPFLDLGAVAGQGGEQGLLGMAFHPNYFGTGPGRGKFYVNYTDNNGDSVVRGYSVSNNPNVADAGSFQDIVQFAQPFANHNGGCLQFGPDGFLYVSSGDGGNGNDPDNRAQDITDQLLGKILRFDVDLPAPFIPPSNPFVGVAGDDEIWAYGLRNPWRFSFDRLTGDMWIGDVGQGQREEIDFQPAGHPGGANYGWRCMEGTLCTGLSGCTCDVGIVLPVDEYDHDTGCSVTGGYRYRGSAMPNFYGRYFYADFCSGKLWSVAFDGTTVFDKIEHSAELAIPGTERFTSFGEDANGELYLTDKNGGEVWKLEEACLGSASNYCTSAPNSVGAGATISTVGTFGIQANNFTLGVTGAPPNVPGLFFFGPNQINVTFGNGFLCTGGGITRISPPTTTDPQGRATRNLDLSSSPGTLVTAGSTWNFQFWYRDSAAGGALFNTSDGTSVTFCP